MTRFFLVFLFICFSVQAGQLDEQASQVLCALKLRNFRGDYGDQEYFSARSFSEDVLALDDIVILILDRGQKSDVSPLRPTMRDQSRDLGIFALFGDRLVYYPLYLSKELKSMNSDKTYVLYLPLPGKPLSLRVLYSYGEIKIQDFEESGDRSRTHFVIQPVTDMGTTRPNTDGLLGELVIDVAHGFETPTLHGIFRRSLISAVKNEILMIEEMVSIHLINRATILELKNTLTRCSEMTDPSLKSEINRLSQALSREASPQ